MIQSSFMKSRSARTKSRPDISNTDIRKIILYETIAFAGWFMFTWGAWSLVDSLGLASNQTVVIIFILVGIGLFVLSIVLTYIKSGRKK